jgi:pimeloyl-ACP methyl ester carboxylesterase
MPGCRLEQRLIPADVLDRFDVRLISIDRPGYGQTDPLSGDRIARVSDVLPVCDALGVGEFTLVANSAGGSFAVTLATLAPERVRRLVLIAAQMPYDAEDAIEQLQPKQLALLSALKLGRVPAVVTGVERARSSILVDPVGGLDFTTLTVRERQFFDQPDVKAAFIEDVKEGLGARVDGFLDDLLTWPHAFEVDPGHVECPVRAIHGTGDDWEPLPNLRRIMPSFRDAQLVLLEGLNHLGPLLYPDLILGMVASDW